MTSLQQVFTRAQAQWHRLEDSKIPIFFVGAAFQEIVSTDYDETDSDKAGERGND